MTRGNYSEPIRRSKDEFPASKFLFLRVVDLYTPESRKKMFQHICRFIDEELRNGSIDLDSVIRFASTSRFKFIRDLVYSDVLLRRMGMKLIPLVELRARIMLLLDKMNSKKITKTDKLDIDKIPRDILIKINQEIETLAEITGLEIDHWCYKIN